MSDPGKAVFLSYASQDAVAAKRICEALRAAGVEVWFDQSELVGGDAWDQKIRKQIRECALLIPIISAATQARTEGYFRLEWRLADQRTHLMAKGRPFLLPVVIDDTRDTDAHVPDSFTEVQWTRLPGGQTPATFTTRVTKLLAGEVGRDRLVPPAAGEAASGPVLRPQRDRSRRWVIPAVLGGIVAMGALIWYQSRPLTGPAPAQPSGQVAQASVARGSIAQIWAQLNKPQLARAELEVAEGFAKRATEADPNDAEAWASSSQVDSWFVLHGLDATAERREAARSKAAKALQLTPTSYEARLAQACYLVRGGGDLVASSNTQAADELLQSLLGERPDEPRALLALATLQGNAGRAAEARSTYERLAANPDFAVVAWNEIGWAEYVAGHYSDAEVAAGRSVALQAYWGNLTLQALLAVWWRGDLDLAKSIYDRIPAAVRQEDHGVANDCQLLFLRREPDALLRLLDGVPRDWLRSNAYDGPKALWAALAQEQLGRPERARLQWQTALAQVERRLVEHPDADTLLRLKASALAALGQAVEADRILQLARDSASAGSIQSFLREVATQLRLGHADAALEALEHEPRLTAAACRIAPPLDVLGSQPRFQALLARLDSDPRASPKAAKAMVMPLVDQKSVAVLAFANLSDDRANEYFSDGISEELLNVLAKVPGLKVTARTSAFHFKGKDTPVPEIARQLGVAYVVEGSVRKSGDKVRITAQLIKAADGFHVWSDTFTRDLKDIFAVQDEIAGLIAKSLSLKLGEAMRVTRTVNPEAHQLYLRAHAQWKLRTAEGFGQAESLLRQALDLDPEFAPGYALLANVGLVRADWAPDFDAQGNPTPRVQATQAYANRAMQLDPQLPEAHVALGGVSALLRRWAEAEGEFRQALVLNPNHATAHQWLARLLEIGGRMDEAIASIRQATELDPLSARIADNQAMILLHAGRASEALAATERALWVQPDSRQARYIKAEILLGTGDIKAARPLVAGLLDQALAGETIDAAHSPIFRILSGIDDHAKVEAIQKRIAGWSLVPRVLAALQLGRKDEALALLDPTALSYWETNELLWSPSFDPIRTTPEFITLLQKTDLTEAHARVQVWRQAHPAGK